ncbi:MAG: hypothetical protein NTV84_00600 [Methanoregula sp.]|nr:hypothetical protein [Methanoregula sp.]
MSVKTLHQIQQEGLDVLVEKLGPDDAIRFLQIYGSFISMNREAVIGRKTGKNTWRTIPIKLSNVS